MVALLYALAKQDAMHAPCLTANLEKAAITEQLSTCQYRRSSLASMQSSYTTYQQLVADMACLLTHCFSCRHMCSMGASWSDCSSSNCIKHHLKSTET